MVLKTELSDLSIPVLYLVGLSADEKEGDIRAVLFGELSAVYE